MATRYLYIADMAMQTPSATSPTPAANRPGFSGNVSLICPSTPCGTRPSHEPSTRPANSTCSSAAAPRWQRPPNSSTCALRARTRGDTAVLGAVLRRLRPSRSRSGPQDRPKPHRPVRPGSRAGRRRSRAAHHPRLADRVAHPRRPRRIAHAVARTQQRQHRPHRHRVPPRHVPELQHVQRHEPPAHRTPLDRLPLNAPPVTRRARRSRASPTALSGDEDCETLVASDA